MANLDRMIEEIVNLRAEVKALTVEVNGMEIAMEDFRLAMEARFTRFQTTIVVTIILNNVVMGVILWGLNKWFGGN